MDGVMRARITCLYRKALKLAFNWTGNRGRYRLLACAIRNQFDKSTDNLENSIKAGEYLLWKYRHGEPYVYPTAPGGVAWERYPVFSEELCKNGFGKGKLQTF